MKSYLLKNRRGLTLIELVAVVAIVAILATVAVVAYRGHLVRARMQDAKVALETVRAEEEQYRAEFGHYCVHNTLVFFRGTNPPGPGIPGTVVVGDYDVAFTKAPAPGDDTYTVRATPNTARQQLHSTYGGWMEIIQDGTRNSEAKPGTWP